MKRVLLMVFVAELLLSGCLSTSLSLPGNPLAGIAQINAGTSFRDSSSEINWRNGNGDNRPIAPGKTLVLADLKGPGVITHFWNTINSDEPNYAQLLILRMYWDGEEQPSVETPIGDFFGVGHGMDQAFQSMPITVTSNGRARNCYWPMPFKRSARITVTNEGEKKVGALFWYIDWQKVPRLPRHTGCFHAMYRQEHPTVMGRNYLIADLEGQGQYVGTVLNVRQHTKGWWGEGDDMWFIDGAQEPQLRGTGSEDYFCDAWGLRQMSNLYYGVPLMQDQAPMAKTSCYRWHIPDPVLFKKSLRLEIEHKGQTFNADGSMKSGFEERSDDFSSVAFWYQWEPHKTYPVFPSVRDRVYDLTRPDK